MVYEIKTGILLGTTKGGIHIILPASRSSIQKTSILPKRRILMLDFLMDMEFVYA